MAAVGPLATTADVAARHPAGVLTDAQETRAAVLLDDASALIRDHLEQLVSFVEDDQVTLKLQGSRLSLPERPVAAVTSVAEIDGTELATTAWSWDGLDLVTVAVDYLAPTLVVTYSHGHEDVPDGIVRVACAMVNRVLTAPTATEGLGGETIGQYSYQAPGGSSGVGVYLSKGDMASLRRWRSSAGTIMVRSW